MPCFHRKIVWYSSTKFCILKPWNIISKLIRFDLDFWQASIQLDRKLEYRAKVLEKFQPLPRFPRKMVLYSPSKFCILNPWALILNIIKFDLGFWQASKPFYTKFKDSLKVLEEFQRLPRFPRKMVLYFPTKFCILKLWAIISSLIEFDLGFWQASNSFYGKLKYREKVLEEFQLLPRFPRKIVFYSPANFHILKPWTIITKLIRFDLGFSQASIQF